VKICSRRRKEAIYSDRVKSLADINDSFDLSKTYERYVNISMKEKKRNKILSTRLAKVGCVLEVFDFIEIAYLCENNFDLRVRTIKLGVNKVPLNPKAFKWLLKLPKSNKR